MPSLRYVRVLFNPGGKAELVFTRMGGRTWSGPSSPPMFMETNQIKGTGQAGFDAQIVEGNSTRRFLVTGMEERSARG